MAPHSSTLAWKIPWMEEPGRLQSMRSLRVGHNWETSLSLFTFLHWRRQWQPTPVFLPGESQGRGSLVGCRLWGHTELETTEVTSQQTELETFILTEVSQKEKNKYCIISLTYGSRKWYRWTYLQSISRVTDIENKLMDLRLPRLGGEGAEWIGRLGLTYILYYV